MPKAIRYRANGQFLQHTLFWTPGDFIGAGSLDPELAALEEAQTLESHKQDFAIAFGIPAESIEVVAVPYDGNPDTLPYAEDGKGGVVRIPEEHRAGYVVPVRQPPTLEEKVAALIAANPDVAKNLGM